MRLELDKVACHHPVCFRERAVRSLPSRLDPPALRLRSAVAGLAVVGLPALAVRRVEHDETRFGDGKFGCSFERRRREMRGVWVADEASKSLHGLVVDTAAVQASVASVFALSRREEAVEGCPWADPDEQAGAVFQEGAHASAFIEALSGTTTTLPLAEGRGHPLFLASLVSFASLFSSERIRRRALNTGWRCGGRDVAWFVPAVQSIKEDATFLLRCCSTDPQLPSHQGNCRTLGVGRACARSDLASVRLRRRARGECVVVVAHSSGAGACARSPQRTPHSSRTPTRPAALRRCDVVHSWEDRRTNEKRRRDSSQFCWRTFLRRLFPPALASDTTLASSPLCPAVQGMLRRMKRADSEFASRSRNTVSPPSATLSLAHAKRTFTFMKTLALTSQRGGSHVARPATLPQTFAF
ncbi:hypothetical protein BJY59DRAFT_696734 [Rhodotorula toruloides]